MLAEDRPKELRIRYDQSTTYPLPMPLACMYNGKPCDCPYCQAAVDLFYTGDRATWRFGVQRWVDYLHDRVQFQPVEFPCIGQTKHLARWLNAQRSVSS